MPSILPFIPSLSPYQFATTIDTKVYQFVVRWNSRANVWYMNILEEDDTPIVCGVPILLGAYLGRSSTHELFRTGVLVARDIARTQVDARFDDLGTRVQIRRYSVKEMLSEIFGTATELPP